MAPKRATENRKAGSGKATYRGTKGRRRIEDNFLIDCGEYEDEF